MATLPEIIADVDACITVNRPVWLWSAPGVGKSQAVAQVAKSRGADLIDIRLSTFDPVDLRGLPTVDHARKVTEWIRPQLWPTDDTRETVIFFDEMDRAAPAVANAALQITLPNHTGQRGIGEHLFPARTRVVAAGNGSTDGRTTSKIGTAQANRFSHLYAEADAGAAAAHWASIGLDPALCAFIRFRPVLITGAAAPGEHAFTSPRSWADCDPFLSLGDAQRARLVRATVGSAAGLEFEAFLQMWRNCPSLDGIIRDPSRADIPTDTGILYAVAAGLASKADHGNIAAIGTYAARLPADWEIACIADAMRRKPGLKATGAYVAFCQRHASVTL